MDDTLFFRVFGSIFGGIGSIFAITGIIVAVNTRSFVVTSVKAPGTVTSFIRSSKVHYPVVKFTPSSGDPITFESNSGSNPPAFKQGQQVEVLYNPQQPSSAMINSWGELWLLPIIFTAMGSLFLLIGGIALMSSFPQVMRLWRDK